jgi:sugar phosphate isomerase/epimerase
MKRSWPKFKNGKKVLKSISFFLRMVCYFALNCGTNHFFNPALGQSLGIEEAEPDLVHIALIKRIQSAMLNLEKYSIRWKKEIKGMIQMNSRDFFFRDEEILAEITKLYTQTQSEKNIHLQVDPSIHQSNDAWPTSDHPQFLTELQKNAKVARQWGCPHIVVHLPVRAQDDTEEVINILTKPEVLRLVQGQSGEIPLLIELENNHHNCFFGNLDHVDNLLTRLDHHLTTIGKAELSQYYNLCFDFGHYISQADKMGYDKPGMLQRFFQNRKNRIKALHLHVNDGRDDQHLLLSWEFYDKENLLNNKFDLAKLKQHTQILLDNLKWLDFPNQENWAIITETDTPFTVEQFTEHLKLIHAAL